MNELDEMVKVAEVSGVLSCLQDAGHIATSSPEEFEAVVEKVASILDDGYNVSDVCEATMYVLR